MPGFRHVGHGDHHEDEADERSLHEQLAAEAIPDATPQWRRQCRNRGRDAKGKARPERDVPNVGEPQFAEIQRRNGMTSVNPVKPTNAAAVMAA